MWELREKGKNVLSPAEKRAGVRSETEEKKTPISLQTFQRGKKKKGGESLPYLLGPKRGRKVTSPSCGPGKPTGWKKKEGKEPVPVVSANPLGGPLGGRASPLKKKETGSPPLSREGGERGEESITKNPSPSNGVTGKGGESSRPPERKLPYLTMQGESESRCGIKREDLPSICWEGRGRFFSDLRRKMHRPKTGGTHYPQKKRGGETFALLHIEEPSAVGREERKSSRIRERETLSI